MVAVLGTVEGLRFAYAVHVLPPGRYGFRRWRWELWHGAHMVASGWRASERDATRAIRRHAADRARRLFGLRRPAEAGGEAFPVGTSVRVDDGAVAFVLVPRALESAAIVA